LGVEPEDPYTPMLRAYEGDKVQIRTLVGAHMSPHTFTVHGVNWLFEPSVFDASDNTSGYRGTQGMGISEHYEMLFTLPRTGSKNGVADYFYSSSSDTVGLSDGNWGIMRGYRAQQPPASALVPLPNNTPPASVETAAAPPATCPATAPQRPYNIVAVRMNQVMDGPVVYNARGRAGQGGNQKLVNLNALGYFFKEDLDATTGKLLPGVPVEPLILRANAGDCITIALENRLPAGALNVGSSSFGIPIETSHEVGLHPQLVSFDVTRSNGINVGKNEPVTVPLKGSGTYTWYAGNVTVDSSGTPQYTPVEFGSIPLTPSDPLMQHPYGMLGALVIEPQDTSWRTDANSRASASVCKGATNCKSGDLLYREFVAIVQDDVSSIRQTVGGAPPPPPGAPITIVGTILNGKVEWAINNAPIPAGGVALTAGQKVSFEIGTGTHGILFNDETSARAVFDIDGSPDKAKFHVFPTQCTIANSYGTTPQPSGHIATLTVKAGATLSPLPFMCSQLCQTMTGSFTLGAAPPPPSDQTEATPIPYTRAINYRTEPLDYRFADPAWLQNLNALAPLGISKALSNAQVLADPQTPVFVARAGQPLRMRMVHPAGINEQVFTMHGHVWQEEPYVDGSKSIGRNPLSQSQGSRDAFGANIAFDAVIEKAGGAAGVPGDYLYRTFIGSIFQSGLWGLLRVAPPVQDVVTITRFSNPKETKGQVLIAGTATVDPDTGGIADKVTIIDTTKGASRELGTADVDKVTGVWPKGGQPFAAPATVTSILVRSSGKGERTASTYIREATSASETAAAQTFALRKKPAAPRSDELDLFNAVPRRAETLVSASGAAGTAQWLLRNQPIAANKEIVVRPGDTITVSVRDGRHDLTFPNAALARSVFTLGMPGVAFAASGQGITTQAIEGGGVLATLTVKSDLPPGTTRVAFTSSVDGQAMTATFVIQR
jgi:hypothetical protein